MKTLLLCVGLAVGSVSFSQVIINEYSCSNRTGPIDAYGEREDWIELHNIGASAFDLSGFFLSDNPNNLAKWQIPVGASVPAGGYMMVFCSKRDELNGNELHPNFALTQTKNEWIILSSSGGAIQDSLAIVNMTQKDHSYGRTTDGALTWSLFSNPTPNGANTGAINYYTAKPTISLAAGFYTGSQSVTLATTDGSATIYYTLDGSVPTTGSTQYTGAINISSTAVLRARAFSSDPNTPPSFVESNTYIIDDSHTLPVLSVYGDQVKDFLEDNAPGSFSNNFDGGYEFFETDGSMVNEGTGYYNKHGNDSWAYDQRGFDLVVRDEYGSMNAIRHDIFPHKNRDEYQKLIVKAAANDNYPFSNGGAHIRDAAVHTLSQYADLRLDERSSRFGIVYVNGEYWGVYDMREKVDDSDFTDHYYNQDKYDIEFLKTWGGTWAEYGDPAMTEWNDLVNYITTGDMTDPVQYAYVKSKYNTGSLIDYVVLNSYIVTSDWLNWNTAWWHGHIPAPEADKQKWRYTLWDNDASWGHYINYTGIPNTNPDADPCNPESLPDPGGQGHIPILNKLMENPEFEQEYIARYADLMNTYFSCDYMIPFIDSMVAVVEPEMPDQIARWGGSMATWQQNVQDLKDYITQRCTEMAAGMVGCYNLSGPYDITVDVDPVGSGQVKINSIYPPSYPFTGQYYGGMLTIFKANPNAGFAFDYWESYNHTFMAPDSLVDSLNFTMADTIIGHFIDTTTTNPPPPPPGGGGNPLPNPTGFTGVHVPNAFSPNADGNNDVYSIYVGWDVTNFQFQLFDRWGNAVFKSSTYGDVWDGRYKSKLVNNGIYTYVLIYDSSETGHHEETGNITVIR
ncbi:CotH kinase family protein [Paracrocinitomix mangrovi]|uniref:CotH kinase family protein n=1 Tax=Paracrocinitomix mangrovi TaxID=2862509 RepID=UPI001C8DEE6A|nr:CotH kinase family protein [Paracrocinitomix mangrovi]UKN00532.1 CotH kinase family protein [Paracrocinitomix mangrovi]